MMKKIAQREYDKKEKIYTADCLFYGSLRKGCYNASRGGDGSAYVTTFELKGFKMFVEDEGMPYPFVREDKDSSITVDYYKLETDAFLGIDAMELGAGYEQAKIDVDGNKYIIYVMTETFDGEQEVVGGNWLTHKNKR